MKRAFMSELAIVRTLVPSIAGVGLFIFVVLTLANASDGDASMSAGACAVSAMSPIVVMNSLAGHDNQNGWERYRATLPLSRKDIICARYLCIVAFSAIMACATVLLSTITLPFFDHTGMPSTGQIVFETTIASAASMLISLMMVFLAQPLFFRFGHGGAAPFRRPVCPARMPCHGHAELLQPHQQLAHVDCWGESQSCRPRLPVRRNCRTGPRAMCNQLHRQHQGLSSTRPVGTRVPIHEGRDRPPQIRDKWHIPGTRYRATCAAAWAAECPPR